MCAEDGSGSGVDGASWVTAEWVLGRVAGMGIGSGESSVGFGTSDSEEETEGVLSNATSRQSDWRMRMSRERRWRCKGRVGVAEPTTTEDKG
jgi:hypothetical protein